MEYIGNIEYDEKLIHKQLVIYGIGKVSYKIYKFLKNNNLHKNIEYFCVSDAVNINCKEFENIQVKALSDVVELLPNADYLIAGKYMLEMLEQLQKKGINNIHILFL